MRTRRIPKITKLWLVVFLPLALLPWAGIAGADTTLDEQLIKAAAFADLDQVKMLLGQGANVNAKPGDGWTPLMAVAWGRYWNLVKVQPGMYQEIALWPAFESGLKGRAAVAKLLLEKGAEVNTKAADGKTALMFASSLAEPDLVSVLLNNGADANDRAADGRTALMLAVNNAGTDVVRLLLAKGACVNARDQNGWTALMRAARFGHSDLPDMSPLLGASDSDMNGAHDWTAFQQAVWKRRSEVIELLEAYGAEVTLTVAAMQGDRRAVEGLLAASCDVNAKSAEGLTPLTAAAELGHSDVVYLLLEKGADVNTTANDGQTALIRAAQKSHGHVAKLLLERGADVNAKATDGETALMCAAERGHTGLVKLLLEKGADVNTKTIGGATALGKAARIPGPENAEVVKLLIENGADVNAKGLGKDWTPLMWQASFGHSDVVGMLLEKGADVNARSPDGRTALWAAEWRS